MFTIHPDGSTTPAWSMEFNYKDTIVTLPPVSYYQFQEAGTEKYILLYSYQPFTYWRKYVDYYEYNEKELDTKTKLYQVFSRFLISADAIKYEVDKMKLEAPVNARDKQYVIPLIIEWTVLD